MSKKVKQVEVVDDDLLKLLLDNISVLSQRIANLQVEVDQLKRKNTGVVYD